jgi:NAD+ kinase
MVAVVVIGDERKGGSRAVIESFAEWLRGEVDEVAVVLDRDARLDRLAADLVVVCGGDGSMLAAARRMGDNQRPTLGINLGRLGFLTAFKEEEARDAVRLALDGKLLEEPRLLLSCRVERGDGTQTAPVLALNDGVLSAVPSAGIVTIGALRGGRELASYAGDGVIVATPTGSTAYSMAAGGPVLSPDLDALVLTPLASHMLTVRPLVFQAEGGVQLRVLDGGGPCSFVIDGQVSWPVSEHDVVTLRPAAVRFRQLTRGPGAFFEILREKFGWAHVPRRAAE